MPEERTPEDQTARSYLSHPLIGERVETLQDRERELAITGIEVLQAQPAESPAQLIHVVLRRAGGYHIYLPVSIYDFYMWMKQYGNIPVLLSAISDTIGIPEGSYDPNLSFADELHCKEVNGQEKNQEIAKETARLYVFGVIALGRLYGHDPKNLLSACMSFVHTHSQAEVAETLPDLFRLIAESSRNVSLRQNFCPDTTVLLLGPSGSGKSTLSAMWHKGLQYASDGTTTLSPNTAFRSPCADIFAPKYQITQLLGLPREIAAALLQQRTKITRASLSTGIITQLIGEQVGIYLTEDIDPIAAALTPATIQVVDGLPFTIRHVGDDPEEFEPLYRRATPSGIDGPLLLSFLLDGRYAAPLDTTPSDMLQQCRPFVRVLRSIPGVHTIRRMFNEQRASYDWFSIVLGSEPQSFPVTDFAYEQVKERIMVAIQMEYEIAVMQLRTLLQQLSTITTNTARLWNIYGIRPPDIYELSRARQETPPRSLPASVYGTLFYAGTDVGSGSVTYEQLLERHP